MRPFDYASPESLEQALSLGAQAASGSGEARYLAGGTDLLTLMKLDLVSPSLLVDIKRLPELNDEISQDGDGEGVSIGALATLAQLETSHLIRQHYPALAEAVSAAATPQLRNMATIGGNLLQRPRCWYFRNSHITCWLKGGDTCPAQTGQNQQHALFPADPCVAVHPSDPANVLMALGASVRLRGTDGERTVAIDDVFALPTAERRTETTLGDDEMMVAIHLPAPAPGSRSAYLKAMDRKVWAFAVVSVAMVLQVEGSTITGARLVLGGVSPVPHRALAAERALLGATIDHDLFGRAADLALAEATPLSENGYKVPLARALIRRALAAAVDG